MTNILPTDNRLRRQLDDLIERTHLGYGVQLGELPLATNQSQAYGHFEDCLAVAGFAAGLGEPTQFIHAWLERAAQAGVEVYRWSSTTVREITYLPSEEIETFIDDTMTSPWTFIRVAYAGLAAERLDIVDELMLLSPEPGQVKRLTVAESLLAFAVGLYRVLKDDLTGARDILSNIVANAVASPPGELLWVMQARTLLILLDKDTLSLAESLTALSIAWDSWYANSDDPLSSERFLVLPVRGLSALAERDLYS